jgi:hypothetical protein
MQKIRNLTGIFTSYKKLTTMKTILLLLLFTTASFAQLPIGTPNDLVVCDDNNDGHAYFNLTENSPFLLNGLPPNLYAVSYHETYEDAENGGANPIFNPAMYINIMSFQQIIYARVAEITNPANYAVAYFEITVNMRPEPYSIDFIVQLDDDSDGVVAVDLTTFNSQLISASGQLVTYYETLADAEAGAANYLVSPYTTGSKTLYARVTNAFGCYTVEPFELVILAQDYETPPPTGENIQYFTEGETLADLEVTGQNIQWYQTAGSNTPIDINTPLVTNTMYYAAQNIYNIESTQRLEIIVYLQPIIGTPNDLEVCDDNNDGHGNFNLQLNTDVLLNNLSPNLYAVSYHETPEDAMFGINHIDQTMHYNNLSDVDNIVYARVTEIATPAHYAVASFQIIVNPKPEANDVDFIVQFDNDTDGVATVDLTAFDAQFQWQSSNWALRYYETLVDAEAGAANYLVSPYTTVSKTLYARVTSETGCYDVEPFELVILPQDYQTPQPAGETIQYFTEGETLANVEVSGQHIQWYQTAEGDTPLNINTPLVNNTTYYAAQSIYNIESTQRLGVTVTNVMGTEEVAFINIRYYPNPVTDILTIVNAGEIDTIAVYNLKGQEIVTKNVGKDAVEVNLQGLPQGTYVLRVSGGSKTRNIKIIKS